MESGISGIVGRNLRSTGFYRDWKFLSRALDRNLEPFDFKTLTNMGFVVTTSSIGGPIDVILNSRVVSNRYLHNLAYSSVNVGLDLLLLPDEERRPLVADLFRQATDRLQRYMTKKTPELELGEVFEAMRAAILEYETAEVLPEVPERPLSPEEVELIAHFRETGRIPAHLQHLRREPRA